MSLRASPIIRLLKPDASSIRFQPTSALSFSTNRVSKSASFFCASRPRGNDLAASRDEGALQDLPLSVDLDPICSEDLFDQIVAEAQVRQELVIVLWMASWCRKCIHLKPKLQKLAADYYPRLRFYCVDVNAVPHKLVCRAGVTLWKECKKQAEVIGGHKAYLVVNEIREMIENELSTS